MRGKVVTKGGVPFRSKLKSYEQELADLRREGLSYRAIATAMKVRHGIEISHNAVFSFLSRRKPHRHFYDTLPAQRRKEILEAITAIWTHDSTAIEGNTINLGDTMLVLKYGLTISGKSLKEHQEIYGHAKAVEHIATLVDGGRMTKEDLFDLHRLVITDEVRDIYRPVGDWKREPNGTYGVGDEGRAVYMSYSDPDEVPLLMKGWLDDFNRACSEPPATIACAAAVYARLHIGFVRVHPFYDGNGRIARLVSNIPVLRGGHPPLVIPSELRRDYIRLLWDYQQRFGQLRSGMEFAPACDALDRFVTLLLTSQQQIHDLLS